MIFNPGALVGYVGLLVLILETPVLSIPTLLKRTASELTKVTLSGATESTDSTLQSSRVLNDVGGQMRLEALSGPYDILEAPRDTHQPFGKDDGHGKYIQNGQGTKYISQDSTQLGKNGEPGDGDGNHFNLNPGMINHPGKYEIRRGEFFFFCEKFYSFCEGSSEIRVKELFMKKFGLLTLEEGIELYNQLASEDQRSSIRLFALGTKALGRETSPLQTYWYFQHLEEMFKHWNDVSSPGKNTILISWEDFRTLCHKFHFDIEAPSYEHLADYLKKLAILDINHEKEEISIHKLLHYTFLYFHENKLQ
ncbi:hypothetical protein PtA15_11A580 [Puccinia triticina]|uniref:Defective in cullin neddylation protein n=1 Tax=Puccinia triticina TaxID=208348 RepID=A0ABY7CX62_9BASI|nr:uncharacterized protein PtA15_11A580 [Puccinia triticina]WAQ89888.1 hypothetical protein PtA15_11A580 [Puccinia triticina]